MKIKPLYDRIVVERIASEEKTAGGIIIPDTAKEKPLEGVVRAVGDGKFNDAGDRIALSVQEGDRILFGKYSGTEINIDGNEHLILREDEVLAIITE
ncbi:MAG: co-chaperone GroES [Xanthomonadales bacterium]|jgi:chaperonin GroES|nr:co-chaperone GroES [Xanthomonadales bacterium]